MRELTFNQGHGGDSRVLLALLDLGWPPRHTAGSPIFSFSPFSSTYTSWNCVLSPRRPGPKSPGASPAPAAMGVNQVPAPLKDPILHTAHKATQHELPRCPLDTDTTPNKVQTPFLLTKEHLLHYWKRTCNCAGKGTNQDLFPQSSDGLCSKPFLPHLAPWL